MVAIPFMVANPGWAFLCLSAALSSGTIFISLAIYRLFLHPLAGLPGPRLAGATYWYEVYYELIHNGGSQYAPKIRQLHAEYGPIVRITPNEVSVNDVEFHDKLYAPFPAVRHRDPSFTAFMGTNNGSFGTSHHYLHRQRRVAYNPFFASSNLSAAEHLIQEKIKKACALLWERRETNPNIRTYLAALSFDSLFTMAFGRPLDLLDNLTSAEECNMTVELLATSPPIYRLFPGIIPLAKRIPQSILRRLSGHVAKIFDVHALILKEAQRFVEGQGREKVSVSRDKSSPETLFSVITRSNTTEEEKDASRMTHEGVEMFMATYTSARTMMTGLYYLHTSPEVLITLRDELKQAYPNPADEMSFKTLNNLPYLRAVVREILRITFPVGCRVPMVCDEDISYGDWVIPAKA
ncbi:hypothetical protein Daus18300_008062 [Diaporthe australafricana]|uniref:Cytochrome P450 n=1 Tax=Diaporthe australafricana TaxID=127596 RepID=A0ABR3WJV7_9PEZI